MSPAVLTLEKEVRNGIHLIRMEGPLDSMTYDQFKDFLDTIAAQPHARIVLDCRNLSYVNSRGITLLAHFQRTLSSSLAFFGIAALNARILKAIELLGVGKLVRLYPTVEEAMAAAEVL
jgi:anti-sigma B factor antagonist